MAILVYVRTLSDEESQVFDRHSEALTAVGCERVFGDRSSRSPDERPSLTTCLAALRRGDVLVVKQLDHLGYRMEALIRFVSDLADQGVGFRALDCLPVLSARRVHPLSPTSILCSRFPRAVVLRDVLLSALLANRDASLSAGE